MSGFFTTVIAAISANVVAGLVEESKAPLSDGAILLGAANAHQQGAPPRIVFEPTTFRIGPPDTCTIAAGVLGPDLMLALARRPLATKYQSFKVHIWAIANPTPGSDQITVDDLDAVDSLTDQLIRSCISIMPGILAFSQGTIANSTQVGDAILAVSGWGARLTIEIPKPVVDYALEFAGATPGAAPGFFGTTSNQPGNGGALQPGPSFEYPFAP